MKRALYIATAVLAFTACSKENSGEIAPEGSDEITYNFELTIEDAPTRVDVGEVSDGKCPIFWENDDEISIGWNTDADASVKQTNVKVKIEDGSAKISFSLPAERHIVGAWYPKGGKPTAGRLEDQPADRGRIILPMIAYNQDDSEWTGTQSSIVFKPVADYSVIRYNFRKGAQDKTISKVTAQIGGKNYSRTGLSLALGSDAQPVYIVVPVSETSGPLVTVIETSDGMKYTRTKGTYTPKSRTILDMPVIADMDNTGHHFWAMGSGETNEAEAPMQYWFRSNDNNIAAITRNDGYMTVLTTLSSGKCRADIAPIRWNNHAYFSTDGQTIINQDSQRLAVHAGNYPVFAVKMTKQELIGTGRYIKVDTNSKEETQNPVRYTGNIGNRNNPACSIAVDENTAIYYFDLSDQKLKNNNNGGAWEIVADTRPLYFYGWQIQVTDITGLSEPATFDVYWAGFFNSVDELTAFAQEN